MQEIKREVLINKAEELLKNGTVDRVLGWKAGEFDYDVTPAVFTSADEISKDFVFNGFCGANFSKYLVKETLKGDNKVLVFLEDLSRREIRGHHTFPHSGGQAPSGYCSGSGPSRT